SGGPPFFFAPHQHLWLILPDEDSRPLLCRNGTELAGPSRDSKTDEARVHSGAWNVLAQSVGPILGELGMTPLSRTLAALGAVLVAAPLFAADGETKDKVTKGNDGWYTVEFQVGTGKMKVDFPGEPKLESDPK